MRTESFIQNPADDPFLKWDFSKKKLLSKKGRSKQSETALYNSNKKDEMIFTTPQEKDKYSRVTTIKGFDAISKNSKSTEQKKKDQLVAQR